MADSIKAFTDQIMSASAVIASDPNRNTEPFYKYGEKWFETYEGTPPQVRWKKASNAYVSPPQKKQSVYRSGSLGTIVQTLNCLIWAEDVDGCIEEFQLLNKSINKIKGIDYNVAGLNQPSNFNNTILTWVDVSPHMLYGQMLTFNYDMHLNLPEVIPSYATIYTASVDVSSSQPGTTGSYDEGVNYTFISSSYE